MPDDILPSGEAEDAENKERRKGTVPYLDLFYFLPLHIVPRSI